jgi:hypothetical protein
MVALPGIIKSNNFGSICPPLLARAALWVGRDAVRRSRIANA